MASREERITEEEARAIWLRAAHLQEESERQLEERARALPIRVDADVEGEGLRIDEVRAAAEAAGIAPEFLQMALGEATASSGPSGVLAASDHRGAQLILGTARPTIQETIVVSGGVAAVSAACLQVFAGHPCLLQAGEVAELPPTSGRVIVFNVPLMDWSGSTRLVMSRMSSVLGADPPFLQNASKLGLRHLHVAVRPLALHPPTCEVVVVADLHPGVRTRWRWSAATSVAGGAVGATVGVGVAASVVSGALLALPAILGAGLVAGAVVAASARTYRSYRGQVAQALRETLQLLPTVARAVTTSQGEKEPIALARPRF